MVHSKVVQATGNFHHEISILFFGISEDIFDNTTSFHPSKDRFNDHADPGKKAVLLALCSGQCFPLRLFLGLKRLNILWFIPLKACLLLQRDVCGTCWIFFITNLFVMTCAAIGLASVMPLARLEVPHNAILRFAHF